MDSLQSGVFLTGTESVRIYRENGITYRSSPIDRIIPVSIYNFEKDVVKEINLSEFLDYNLRVIGVNVDIPTDDNDTLQSNSDPNYQPTVRADVQIKRDSKTTDNLILFFTSYPPYVNQLIIRHLDKWFIKMSRDVNSVNFLAVPVHIDKPVVFP